MSLKLNVKALERVCKVLDIDCQRGFGSIFITPEQQTPVGVCLVNHDTGECNIYINSDLSVSDANFVALHELKHVSQEIHDKIQSQGKYQMEAVALGFDEAYLMKMDREPLTEEESARYNQISYEKEANDFAYLHEDLYQVVVEA